MKKIIGASVGSCIHVAGIINFLKIASELGFETKFIGSAVNSKKIIEEIDRFSPDIIGLSYRLSPESAVGVFSELKESLEKYFSQKTNKAFPSLSRQEISKNNAEKTKINKKELNYKYPDGEKIKFILGTTKPVMYALKENGILNIFDKVFTGGESFDEIKNYLLSQNSQKELLNILPQNLIERINYKKPYPLLRHHFGRPSFNETLEGIKIIADSKLIDVISIGPDQNTQEFFFNPSKMDHNQDGAGGVPIRSEEDLKKIYEASRTGNFPLLRCYSGTNNILQFAEVLVKNINNAWCAIPLCWYNELDNRSGRTLKDAISENQLVMKWHAQKNIPVEVNESHHWSLRYAPDSIAVAAAYLAAYNAKKMGVKNYISQYMFNTPPETSFTMDLAKMLAKIDLIESLHDENFISWRQTRTGLFSMEANFNKNKGQLASSTLLQMQLDPSIVHVVAYCESEYAAKPEDIIESAQIVTKVIDNYLNGCPDMKNDKDVQERKKQLINDARLIINKIKELDFEHKFEDPLISPEIISKAIKLGILDAPHLKGVKAACGKILTKFFNGANYAIDKNGNILSEKERLNIIY